MGFSFRWRLLVLCWKLRRCSGDTRCRKWSCALVERFSHASDTRKRGGNIHRLIIWRSKHCKQLWEINKTTQQTNFLIRVEFPAVSIEHHQQGISSRDPAGSGGEEGEE